VRILEAVFNNQNLVHERSAITPGDVKTEVEKVTSQALQSKHGKTASAVSEVANELPPASANGAGISALGAAERALLM
jgi:hypothetical protein